MTSRCVLRDSALSCRRRGSAVFVVVMMAFLLLCTGPLRIPIVSAQRFDCDKNGTSSFDCVDRPSYYIKAIVHGTKNDPFWQQLRASMYQTAKDLKVDLECNLYDTFDPVQMSNDLRAIFSTSNYDYKPDALIVTVPDSLVQSTLGDLMQFSSSKIPVFGLNTGVEVASTLGILGYVSMDEYYAGTMAGDYVKEIRLGKIVNNTNMTTTTTTTTQTRSPMKGIYINHEFGNLALEERFLGLYDSLPDADFTKVNFFAGDAVTEPLLESFDGCDFDTVILAGSVLLDDVFNAMSQNGCDIFNTTIGAFDTNPRVYEAIALGELDFTISQQLHLQAALPVVMATMYITTGRKLAGASTSYFGNYQSGPKLITLDNMPTWELQACEQVGFPVCGNDDSGIPSLPDTENLFDITDDREQSCGCTDRSKITIVGITHGDTKSTFWDWPYAAMEQAGKDFGIKLHLPRLEPQLNDEILHGKMAAQITEFCEAGNIDGLFTSLPNNEVIDAVKRCQELNIPVVSINSGADISEELGLMQHIGQLEFRAGKNAGQIFLDAGIKKVVCFPQEENNVGLFARCDGVKEAFEEAGGVEYLGMKYIKPGAPDYVDIAESMVGETGSWEGIAIMSPGQNIVPDALKIQEKHPDAKIGSFDTSDILYETLTTNQVMFGIDQNPYLQGYLPVAILTWFVSTNQRLVDHVLETGPDFIFTAPTKDEQLCQSIYFNVCDNVTPTRNRTVAYTADETSGGDHEVASATICTWIAVALSSCVMAFL